MMPLVRFSGSKITKTIGGPMKRNFKFLLLISMMVSLLGCSSENEHFDDKDIKIKLVDSQLNKEFNSYTIEIENKGNITIEYINFYLSYPIKQPNGFKGNPFKIEGKADKDKPIKLKSGEKVRYSILAPINEVFGHSDLMDFEHPSIELNGFVNVADKEIPFGMSGGLEVYTRE
ncbi:hypothetical protein [Paenibacillus sp. KN14-4R]|uniref:hypothetical protein n=1 Tax=Paenibacillus sp. KN14-4R TaxID=3445773 RepID=UPI003F9EC24B